MIEVNAPDKAQRRRRGKTDTLDAEAAARAVLSGRASGSAKAGDGPVEMLRMFKLAKDSAVKSRTQAINQLKAVLVAADPQLREALSGLTNTMLIRRCAQLETTTPRDVTSAAVYTLHLLAQRILELTKEIDDLVHHITDTITRHCPTPRSTTNMVQPRAQSGALSIAVRPATNGNRISRRTHSASTPTTRVSVQNVIWRVQIMLSRSPRRGSSRLSRQALYQALYHGTALMWRTHSRK